MVLQTCALGFVSVLVVMVLAAQVWSGYVPTITATPASVLLAVAITTAGQMVHVRVRHGDTWEEHNFYEVALAAGVLLLSADTVLIAGLTAVLIGEVVIRRGEWLKIAYNMGMYAAATSAMIAVYFSLASSAPVLSPTSVLSLVIAFGAFTAVNLVVLAHLIHITDRAPHMEVIREEWRLSILVALSAVGIGAISVALGTTPGLGALLPFAFAPVVALWYAYLASAEHAEARARNRWLVRLGGSLAHHGQGADDLAESAEAIRQIVGAPQMLIADGSAADRANGYSAAPILAELTDDPGPRELAAHELPRGWACGVATRLELTSTEHGALLLGSTRPYHRSRLAVRRKGWTLNESDAPVLGALVAAVGSAMRAGAAFRALTEEKQKLTAVVDNTSDGIAMIDEAGGVRLWSQTMAQMTGVAQDALPGAGQPAPAVVAKVIDATKAQPEASDRTPVQVHLDREDGEELDVSISTVWVRESVASASDDAAGWVAILTVHDETTERRVARMKTDFVATISHELRTPITPIKGYAHLLATRGDRVPAEKRMHALQVISERADHLARLVDDLLAASRGSDAVRLDIKLGVEDLAEVVAQTVSSFPELAHRTTVELPEEPVAVRCDRIRVVQCLSNLLSNAAKYTENDTPVEVWTKVVGPNVQVHVRDHGRGIPIADQERVFQRFYRREDPFTMRTSGAGLGLHIARELALAMGGGLTVGNPAEGKGSEFVLHLPVATDEDQMASRSPAPSAEPGYRPDPRPTAAPPSPEPLRPSATMGVPQGHGAAAP